MVLTIKAAADSLASTDLIGLGMEADAARRRMHPESVVTYTLDLSQPSVANGNATKGGTDVLLAELLPHTGTASLPELEATLRSLAERGSRVAVHGLSAETALSLAAEVRVPIREVLERLQAVGLRSLNADGALLLNDGLRQRAFSKESKPGTSTAADWLSVHRIAHLLGLRTLAAMVIGAGEQEADRIAHLTALRDLQSETGGFVAFALSVHHSPDAAQRREEEATAVDYLKTLAVARMFLEEIPHISADWLAQGPKILELALRFGADDAGTIPSAQINTREPSHHGGESELRRIIRDAGFRPVARDFLFSNSRLH